jgi:hypothetical protein
VADDESTTDDGPTDDPAGDDIDDPSTSDDTGGDDGDGGEAGADDWTPPSKEDFEKLQATLKARNAKLAEARKRAAAAERKAAGITPKAPAKKKAAAPAAGVDPDDDGDDESIVAAEEAAAERVRVSQVRAAATGALLAAGFAGDRKAAKDMVRLMDLSDVIPDAEGDVDDDDLADALDSFKDRFPWAFQQATTERRPVRRPSTADRTTTDRKPPEMDATARMTRKLLKQGGYR